MLRSRFEKTEYGIPVVINRIANPELADPPTLNMVVRKAEATPLLAEGTEPMDEGRRVRVVPAVTFCMGLPPLKGKRPIENGRSGRER